MAFVDAHHQICGEAYSVSKVQTVAADPALPWLPLADNRAALGGYSCRSFRYWSLFSYCSGRMGDR
jgi:hypothetical protein